MRIPLAASGSRTNPKERSCLVLVAVPLRALLIHTGSSAVRRGSTAIEAEGAADRTEAEPGRTLFDQLPKEGPSAARLFWWTKLLVLFDPTSPLVRERCN